MATSYPTKDEVTCTLCLDIYDDPHVLVCDHIFCLTCLESHEEGGQIQCPVCRQITDKHQLVADLNTKERCLIYKTREAKLEVKKAKRDVEESVTTDHQPEEKTRDTSETKHRVEEEEESEDEASKEEEEESNSTDLIGGRRRPFCTMCNSKTNKAKARCLDCELFMCSDCIIRHSNIRVCKDHKVKSLEEVVQLCESKLVNMMNELIEVRQEVTNRSNNIDQSMRDLQISQAEQQDLIHKTTQESIRKLEEDKKQMTQKIRDSNAAVIKGLRAKVGLAEQRIDDLQVQISNLTEAANSQDIRMLHDAIRQAKSPEVQEMRKQIQELSQHHEPVESPIVVQKSKHWDVRKILDVEVDQSVIDSCGTSD